MKKTFFWVFFCVFCSSIVFGQDLSLNQNDLRIEIRDEGGFHLFIRKKAGVSSVLLIESMRDTAFRHDNFAYRAREWNSVNGDETRLLNGVPISRVTQYSLISSTEVRHPELGAAFQIYIPWVLEYGHAPNRHGEVHVGNGTFINIRTFALPYADYRGNFADNPFTLSGLNRTGSSNDNFTSNDQRQFVQSTRDRGVILPTPQITTVPQNIPQTVPQTATVVQTSPDLTNINNRQAEADRQISALSARLTQIENENQRLATENRRLTEQAALNRGDGTVTHICDQVCDHDCDFENLLVRQTETDRQITELRNTIDQLSQENRRLALALANQGDETIVTQIYDFDDITRRQTETDRQITELRNRIEQLSQENRRLADQLANQQRTTPAQTTETTETVTQRQPERQTEQPRTPTDTTPRERRPIYTGAFVGLGPEINGNTREGLSFGGFLTGGIELIDIFAIGLRVSFSTNFHTVTTLEPSVILRYMPFGKNDNLAKGLFIEASGGYGTYFEYDNTYPFPVYALGLGWRYNITNLFYIEPVARFGNPFTWGFGISAGLSF